MNSRYNSSVPLAHEPALFLYKQSAFSPCLIVVPFYPAFPQSEILPDTRSTEVDQNNVREPVNTQCERDSAQRDSRATTSTPVPTSTNASNETPHHSHSNLCDGGKA